ncbi:MAG: phosphoribosylanthranilate isomerase [Pirellulales bacterium]|nr:phosphoribosylanthranilate isomerase [Pirellulales bacterium]
MFSIKICGVTNSDDARLAIDAGADALGFNFFSKSQRFVDVTTARSIVNELLQEVFKIGVFVNLPVEEVIRLVNDVRLDAIQLHGDEPPLFLAQLPASVPIIRAWRASRENLIALETYLADCKQAGRLPDALLLDADSKTDFGGTGEVADWNAIASRSEALRKLPVILAGGLNPTNVATAIQTVQPDGVDVASGVESSPGKKSEDLVRQFVSKAREALK